MSSSRKNSRKGKGKEPSTQILTDKANQQWMNSLLSMGSPPGQYPYAGSSPLQTPPVRRLSPYFQSALSSRRCVSPPDSHIVVRHPWIHPRRRRISGRDVHNGFRHLARTTTRWKKRPPSRLPGAGRGRRRRRRLRLIRLPMRSRSG